MIDGESLTEHMRLARELSRCGPGPVYVMVSPNWDKAEVMYPRDAIMVMRHVGWKVYAEFLHGERI